MPINRSAPPCAVVPVLHYPDVDAAADWLCRVFGFKIRLRIGDHRIQLHAGGGCVVAAEGSAPFGAGHAVMVRVADARSHCEQAREVGARILAEPVDHVFGERQYSAEDLAGHRWTFTESIADVAPEQWGGIAVDL